MPLLQTPGEILYTLCILNCSQEGWTSGTSGTEVFGLARHTPPSPQHVLLSLQYQHERQCAWHSITYNPTGGRLRNATPSAAVYTGVRLEPYAYICLGGYLEHNGASILNLDTIVWIGFVWQDFAGRYRLQRLQLPTQSIAIATHPTDYDEPSALITS